MSIRTVVLGLGYVGTTLMVGVEKIKAGLLDYCGVPLGDRLEYGAEDIEFVGAYDVDSKKVGLTAYDVSLMYHSSVPESLKRVSVRPGVHLGGLRDMPIEVQGIDDDMTLAECVERLVREWERLRPDVLVNLCTTEGARPFGSPEELEEAIARDDRERVTATQLYAYAAIQYSRTSEPVAFINGIPTPVANDPALLALAEEAGAVLLGDDGATGATPLTADMLEHLAERGRRVLSIAQFNIGGNADFLALTREDRNKAKQATKSKVVSDILGYDAPHYIRPTGYLEPLGDKKFVSMHIMYVSFNGAVDEIIVNMRINDSPAFAGLLVDLVRLARIALDRGLSGTVYEINAFYMKSPGPPGSRVVSKVVAYYKLLDWLGESLRGSRAARAPEVGARAAR